MAFAISICIAVLVTLAIFGKEYKSTDQSPIIFLLGVTLLAVLCYVSGVTPMQFTKGPGTLAFAGIGVVFMLLASGTTFKVLTSMPASAYKALAPAAICVGVILLLGLTVL